jgi:hypothetical protein
VCFSLILFYCRYQSAKLLLHSPSIHEGIYFSLILARVTNTKQKKSQHDINALMSPNKFQPILFSQSWDNWGQSLNRQSDRVTKPWHHIFVWEDFLKFKFATSVLALITGVLKILNCLVYIQYLSLLRNQYILFKMLNKSHFKPVLQQFCNRSC